MSNRPYEVAGREPTGQTLPLPQPLGSPSLMMARAQVAGSSPQQNFLPSVPRAAFSHSASVGSRLPFQEQNSTALNQEMPVMG